MVSYINETDFVVENKKLVYPEIVTDGLQLYYDAKGKRDTDYHRDTMLDMSGNKNHGKLHNFAYEKHSGYKDGLVFDYVDDKLVRPTLNLKPNDFTFMLNGNIISFAPDGTVKRVQDGEVIEDKEVAPNAQDLIDRSEYNGNILGDMENIIDGLYKTEVLSGTEIFTDKADADAVVHVEIDGKSMQEGEPNPDYPIEIHSLNDFDVVSQKSEGGAIDGIEVGGRNLLLGTAGGDKGFFKDFTNITEEYAELTLKSKKQYTNIDISEFFSINGKDYIQGDKYIWSYEIMYTSWNFPVGTSRNEFWMGQRYERVSWTPITHHILPVVGQNGVELNKWYKNQAIVTIPANRDDGSITRGRIQFYNPNPDIEASFTMRIKTKTLKLEKGNKATDWSPAPEDITENDNHPLIDKINLSLSEPLRSVGDVKDRLFRDSDGLWKVERNVGEYLVTGLESWIVHRFSDETKDTFELASTSVIEHEPTLNEFKAVASNLFKGVRYTNPLLNEIRIRNNSASGTYVTISVNKGMFANLVSFKNWLLEKHTSGKPMVIIYKKSPTVETLPQADQDKLNNLRSFQDSNYVYTIINNKTDILSENIKPTLHAKFLYNNWYKEDRVINNLMIYNRALTNEEMLQNYKTIKRRWGM